MSEKYFNTDATLESDSASIYELMLTTAMLEYYRVYPKLVFEEFAVLYAPDDISEELKLELEAILGLQLKFEALPEERIMEMIKQSSTKDLIFQ